jgi:aryl-alcohol dehydrogenase-like predicted oxidoreductase
LCTDYIVQAAEASLRRRQVDCIDLYQSHWDDENTPFEETLGAYDRLIGQEKVKAIGASNLSAPRLAQALEVSRAKGLSHYATVQPEYNLCARQGFEAELQSLCVRENIGVITYFSLAAGFITGKYRSADDFGKSARGAGMKKYLTSRGTRILDALDHGRTTRWRHASSGLVGMADGEAGCHCTDRECNQPEAASRIARRDYAATRSGIRNCPRRCEL